MIISCNIGFDSSSDALSSATNKMQPGSQSWDGELSQIGTAKSANHAKAVTWATAILRVGIGLVAQEPIGDRWPAASHAGDRDLRSDFRVVFISGGGG